MHAITSILGLLSALFFLKLLSAMLGIRSDFSLSDAFIVVSSIVVIAAGIFLAWTVAASKRSEVQINARRKATQEENKQDPSDCENRDYYKILSLTSSASQEEINRRCIELGNIYRSDKNPSNEEAAKNFRTIEEAFAQLGTIEARAKYDGQNPVAVSEKVKKWYLGLSPIRIASFELKPNLAIATGVVLAGVLFLALGMFLTNYGHTTWAGPNAGIAAYQNGDYKTALSEFSGPAKQGHAIAQYILGTMYANGQGVPKDYNEAVKWFSLAAKQGNAGAQYNLGRMYYSGHGMPKDYLEAVKWFRLAAEQGKADAESALGEMYINGYGVPKSDNEAFKWFRLAADQGNAVAQYNVGVMYANGRGILKDDNEAFKWFRRAADQGNAGARFSLGTMYRTGQGIPKDDNEAVKWLRLAADQGDTDAQGSLGAMYINGYGVPKSDNEAFKWFRLAADQGNAVAQYNVGVMYANGQGIQKDENEADKWYRLAADQGYANAQKALQMTSATGSCAASRSLLRSVKALKDDRNRLTTLHMLITGSRGAPWEYTSYKDASQVQKDLLRKITDYYLHNRWDEWLEVERLAAAFRCG